MVEIKEGRKYQERSNVMKFPKPSNYISSDLLHRGCSCQSSTYKEKCYFFCEVQDMSARIPICNYAGKLGECPCNNCNKFIAQSDVLKIVKRCVDDGKCKIAKYIDGDMLYRKIAGHSYYHGDAVLTAISIMQEGKEYNHDVPFAEVKPIIHAKLEYPEGADIPNCSNCGKWVDLLQGTAEQNYCMNCGAIFDKESD